MNTQRLPIPRLQPAPLGYAAVMSCQSIQQYLYSLSRKRCVESILWTDPEHEWCDRVLMAITSLGNRQTSSAVQLTTVTDDGHFNVHSSRTSLCWRRCVARHGAAWWGKAGASWVANCVWHRTDQSITLRSFVRSVRLSPFVSASRRRVHTATLRYPARLLAQLAAGCISSFCCVITSVCLSFLCFAVCHLRSVIKQSTCFGISAVCLTAVDNRTIDASNSAAILILCALQNDVYRWGAVLSQNSVSVVTKLDLHALCYVATYVFCMKQNRRSKYIKWAGVVTD